MRVLNVRQTMLNIDDVNLIHHRQLVMQYLECLTGTGIILVKWFERIKNPLDTLYILNVWSTESHYWIEVFFFIHYIIAKWW